MAQTESPRSFKVYLVACLAARDEFIPLAVVAGPVHGLELVRSCEAALRQLRAPANRIAIQGEVELARACRTDHNLRIKQSNQDAEVSFADTDNPSPLNHDFDGLENCWGAMCEYPILSTCLVLGLNRLPFPAGTKLGFECQALSTKLDPRSTQCGAVLIDISDLDRICMGYVHNRTDRMVLASGSENDGRASFELLSTYDYATRFQYATSSSILTWLKHVNITTPDVDRSAMLSILPPLGNNLSLLPPIRRQPRQRHHNGLYRQAMRALIRGTSDATRLDDFTLQSILHMPNFQATLVTELKIRPGSLGPSPLAAQLLALAYAGQDDLNWAAFRQISYATVAEALASPNLSGAKTIALCTDSFADQPAPAFHAMAHLKSLQTLCLLQNPSRTSDDAGIAHFCAIAGDIAFRSLISSTTIFFSIAYSRGLQGRPWLPTARRLPYSVFPIQQVWVRRAFMPPVGLPPVIRLSYHYLEDGLLRPERFAVSLLWFLRGRLNDTRLYAFARASGATTTGPVSTITGPILADANSDTKWKRPEAEVICRCPRRNLVPGSWTAVISCDHDMLDTDSLFTDAIFVRYALVKPCGPIPINCPHNHGEPAEEAIPAEDILACDLAGFLREVAPSYDGRAVQDELSALPWVSSMDAATVAPILQELIRGAACEARA